MKVFISQSMKNVDPDTIKENIGRIEEILVDKFGEDVEIIDSLNPDYKSHTPVECLSWSLGKLAEADLVYFSKGWRSARGCKIEKQVALAYGYATIIE